MEIKEVFNVFFSPSGTTKKITSAVSSVISDAVSAIDLINLPLTEKNKFSDNDVLVVGVPVFAGRVPKPAAELLAKLHGSNTPAIAIVVFGNRAYDDALLELSDLLHNQGFSVIGAVAFVAEHSIFKQVACGRPDDKDFSKIVEFASICSKKLETFSNSSEKLSIPGRHPYLVPPKIPLVPKGNSTCIDCGLCATLCPTGAINSAFPRKTNKDKCISCTACIAACPTGARAFRGPVFFIAGKSFSKKCSNRLEPEWFL